jgi:hypothetical protein
MLRNFQHVILGYCGTEVMRDIDKWKLARNPEINFLIHGQVIFTKVAGYWMRKETLLENWIYVLGIIEFWYLYHTKNDFIMDYIPTCKK